MDQLQLELTFVDIAVGIVTAIVTLLPGLEKYLERQLEGKDQYTLSDMIEDSDLSR